MKQKNVILSMITISAILISIPTLVFAIMPHYQYNSINMIISMILSALIPIIALIYIIWGIKYLIKSKDDKIEKIKKIVKWLIITIVGIAILIVGNLWVFMSGRESWSPMSNTVFQHNKFAYATAQTMRLIALGSIIADIIFSVIYAIKSKEADKKIKNITKGIIMTVVTVVLMLYIAPIVEDIGGSYVKNDWGIFLK